MIYKFTSIEAAQGQLNFAILLLVNDNALIPAITLAAAAEEVLSKILGERSIFNHLKTNLSQKFPNLSAREVGDHLVKIRNALKHLETLPGDMHPEYIESELETQAIMYIFRAIINLHTVNGLVPNEYEKFMQWVDTNHKSLFSYQ